MIFHKYLEDPTIGWYFTDVWIFLFDDEFIYDPPPTRIKYKTRREYLLFLKSAIYNLMCESTNIYLAYSTYTHFKSSRGIFNNDMQSCLMFYVTYNSLQNKRKKWKPAPFLHWLTKMNISGCSYGMLQLRLQNDCQFSFTKISTSIWNGHIIENYTTHKLSVNWVTSYNR